MSRRRRTDGDGSEPKEDALVEGQRFPPPPPFRPLPLLPRQALQRPPAPPAPEPLPVETSTTVIVGYRTWGLSRSYPDGCRLVSSYCARPWEPFRRAEAGCLGNPWLSVGVFLDALAGVPGAHSAAPPDRSCHCGIYAYRDKVALPMATEPRRLVVAGEVSLWGRVLVCPFGYRAQYAYPRRLVVEGGDQRVANSLELAYGVPCEVWD